MELAPRFAPMSSDTAVLGELVALDGPISGSRLPLSAPLILIGQMPACEICLTADGIRPLHCAILVQSGGVLLRHLGAAATTLVNGQPITTCPLRNQDVLAIGPFQFRVDLIDPSAADEAFPDPVVLQAERDALRIQVAAVAAQQTGLTDEEVRLQQRRTALERQESQLAAHLEERRQRLLTWQEQLRQDRATLKEERDTARRHEEQQRQELDQARAEAVAARQQAQRERLRFIELRKRLKRRWRRHWQAHESVLRRREQELSVEHERLRRETETLRRERAHLLQAQLRFNGEAELGRRELREEWQQLGLSQQQWEECLNLEQAERDRRMQALAERTAAVTAAERMLAKQQRLWQQTHTHLRKDLAGLENRIRNQRHKLTEAQTPLVSRPLHAEADTAKACTALVAMTQAPPVEWTSVLQRLAGSLADQRLHLLEQWQHLLQVHELWQREHALVLADVETTGQKLYLREQRLQVREQALLPAEAELRQRQEMLAQVRCSLEGWHARLTLREAAWEDEQLTLLTEVRLREEMAATQLRRLERLRQRWLNRRRQEQEQLLLALTQCEEIRQQYVSLWRECQQRRAGLAQDQQTVAAQMLALERYRQETLARSSNSAAAEKRLERLRRRHLARLESDEQDLSDERQLLHNELARMEEWARRLRGQEAEQVRQREAWARGQIDHDDRQYAVADAEEQRQRELQRLRMQHEQDQRQLAELRDEVERMARLLLDEAETVPVANNQAA